jgi:hypothetical protein
MQANRAIAVLGMHRSGTSCLTGTLEEAGVFLGDVSRNNPHNQKGNHENQRIMELHEDLLQANGGCWDNPPHVVTWSPHHKALRDAIIQSYASAALWGFKDPRTVLTLDGWIEALPNLTLVAIFRHPLLVAQSLQARNALPIEQGLELWRLYNEQLLGFWYRYRFPILPFDGDEDHFRQGIFRVLDALNLPKRPPQLRFFEPRLRTTEVRAAGRPLPEQTSRLYDRLNEIAS